MRDRRGETLSLSLALPVAAVLAAAGCALDPVPLERPDGGSGVAGRSAGPGGAGGSGGAPAPSCVNLPIPAIACAFGETVTVCVFDSAGRPTWKITCPEQSDAGTTGTGGVAGTAGGTAGRGAGGAAGRGTAGSGGGSGRTPCASTATCAKDEVCTTEDGACNAPPGCTTGMVCPAVCYGECRPASNTATPCASTATCAKDEVCTTEDGVCRAPPGCGPNVGCPAVCYGECRPARSGGTCTANEDCHLEADYCTGCDCRALAKGETLPRCPGPGVACLVDPCGRLTARCVNGKCAAQ